jgi:hypothetical protein
MKEKNLIMHEKAEGLFRLFIKLWERRYRRKFLYPENWYTGYIHPNFTEENYKDEIIKTLLYCEELIKGKV